MPKEFQKFVISQKGMIMQGERCLILRLSKYNGIDNPDIWDMPGGRINEGEDGLIAFAREIEEEVGLKEFRNLGVIDYCIYSAAGNPYCGIISLIEVGDQEIKLSPEHYEMKWITADEADGYVYCWKKMPEMIKRGFEVYKKIY